MYCPKCGNKAEKSEKYCSNCGKSLLFTNKIDGDGSTSKTLKENVRGKLISILDFSKPKNLLNSLLWYIFAVLTVIPLHMYYPDDTNINVTLLINVLATIYILSSATMLRKWDINTKTIAVVLVSGVVSYFLGLYFGLIGLFVILMGHNTQKDLKDDLNQAIQQFIYRGFVVYWLGNILSIGSLFVTDSGTYTFFYGAIIYGLYVITRGFYYYLLPEKFVVSTSD